MAGRSPSSACDTGASAADTRARLALDVSFRSYGGQETRMACLYLQLETDILQKIWLRSETGIVRAPSEAYSRRNDGNSGNQVKDEPDDTDVAYESCTSSPAPGIDAHH